MSKEKAQLVVHVWPAAHFIFGVPKPMLSPHELDRICVTHYASIDKAEAPAPIGGFQDPLHGEVGPGAPGARVL